MSWNLWPSAAPELPPSDEEPAARHGGGLELLDDAHDAVQVLPPEDEPTGCWHVRPVPSCEPGRATAPLRPDHELRRHRPAGAGEQADLRSIGLPEHLVPPRGGIFALLTQLERMPPARLPSLRPGDQVTVVAVRSGDGHRAPPGDRPSLAGDVRRVLGGLGTELEDDAVHLFDWPVEDDPIGAAAAEADLVERVRSLRARIDFVAVHPDCAATIAYAACRALPTAQLYLTGVLSAVQPAAPLGWGAPIAFVDGRPATPAVLAAVLADRLAGGVA
jgi:hypothetical protein